MSDFSQMCCWANMMIALWVSHSGRCRYDGSSYYLCSKIYSILVTPRTHFILETFATLTFAISAAPQSVWPEKNRQVSVKVA